MPLLRRVVQQKLQENKKQVVFQRNLIGISILLVLIVLSSLLIRGKKLTVLDDVTPLFV